MRIISLTFDDGIEKTCLRAAQIFENLGLSASFNVIATGHLPSFQLPDKYHIWPRGDFTLWNELRARGHEIMPHGYDHTNKSKIPFEIAKSKIEQCLDVFIANLKGFEPHRAIFHFPHNVSTPPLNLWLSRQVRAYRLLGHGINPIPSPQTQLITTTACGPHPCDQDLDHEIDRLLKLDSGWLVYNLHGLDDEGWGPIKSGNLERALERLLQNNVEVLPPAQALDVRASAHFFQQSGAP